MNKSVAEENLVIVKSRGSLSYIILYIPDFNFKVILSYAYIAIFCLNSGGDCVELFGETQVDPLSCHLLSKNFCLDIRVLQIVQVMEGYLLGAWHKLQTGSHRETMKTMLMCFLTGVFRKQCQDLFQWEWTAYTEQGKMVTTEQKLSDNQVIIFLWVLNI